MKYIHLYTAVQAHQLVAEQIIISDILERESIFNRHETYGYADTYEETHAEYNLVNLWRIHEFNISVIVST